MPTPTVSGFPPFSMDLIKVSMQVVETNCRVRLLGPMQDWSFCVAFAEMVMIAFKKSPAEVWTEAGYSGDKNDSKVGMRFWALSH